MDSSNMDFLNLALTFPTIIFTALLLVVILFWVITLLGFADIDMFESDLDIEPSSSNSNSAHSASNFGFGSIPITVSISLVVMLSWLISIYAHKFFAYLLCDGVLFYVFGLVMLVVSAIIALPIAVIISKPLQRFFSSVETSRSSDLLGLECVVVTGKVTQTFGQGRVNFQGTEQLIEIRSHDEHPFSSGDTVVLLEHIKEQHCYIVTAKPW
ncbi:OB-fold-containig protein [Pseudoalteromonas sp. 10-33]|uniref:OB-fold-containig protein n=1 Tax=Pseudoalteromonas sp. 10-33 TaxID=1761890 RepID=UPI001F452B99|nr:OB-fold-containig protein [Pseudoalteromonas sp. 10-33]